MPDNQIPELKIDSKLEKALEEKRKLEKQEDEKEELIQNSLDFDHSSLFESVKNTKIIYLCIFVIIILALIFSKKIFNFIQKGGSNAE